MGDVVDDGIRVIDVDQGYVVFQGVYVNDFNEENGFCGFAGDFNLFRYFLNPCTDVRVDDFFLGRVMECRTRLRANAAARRRCQVPFKSIRWFLR